MEMVSTKTIKIELEQLLPSLESTDEAIQILLVDMKDNINFIESINWFSIRMSDINIKKENLSQSNYELLKEEIIKWNSNLFK